jgi:transposase
MKKLQITRAEPGLDELRVLYDKEKDGRMKIRFLAMILLHELGSARKVARTLHKSHQIMADWVHAFNDQGLEGLKRKSPPGAEPRLTNEQQAMLREDVLKNPRELGYDFSDWDGKSVSFHVKNKFNVKIGVRAAQYYLHRLDLVLIRPKTEPVQGDPEKQELFKQELKKRWMPSSQTKLSSSGTSATSSTRRPRPAAGGRKAGSP